MNGDGQQHGKVLGHVMKMMMMLEKLLELLPLRF
jgi:hypothetical protein